MNNTLLGLIALNIITFGLYGLDKYYARTHRWRIPESTLLFFALLGGSPAAYAAQQFFRHKNRKSPFRLRFWLIVVIQVIALAVFLMKPWQN